MSLYTVRRRDEEFACPTCGAPVCVGDRAWQEGQRVYCSAYCAGYDPARTAQGPPLGTIHCDECWAEVDHWADYPGGVRLCLTCDGLERWAPLVPAARAHNP